MEPELPDNAKKVFEGVIFDVYQWEQKLFDGSTATFEKLKRAPTTCVLAITEDKKILVTIEEQPGRASFTSIPAGRVDLGEEPEAAAKRELLEETGYEPQEFFLWRKENHISKIDWGYYLYIAKGCKKVTEPKLDSGEKIEVKKLELDEFYEFLRNKDFRDPLFKAIMFEMKCYPEEYKELKNLLFD